MPADHTFFVAVAQVKPGPEQFGNFTLFHLFLPNG
jgi:hypothetical protein